MFRGRKSTPSPVAAGAAPPPNKRGPDYNNSLLLFITGGCLLPAILFCAFARRDALVFCVGPLCTSGNARSRPPQAAAVGALPLRVNAMGASGVTYSEAALAQAQKDGSSYLAVLKKAGLLGKSRDVRITAVPVHQAASEDGSNRPAGESSKTVHLIRHGQGYHNLLGELYQEMGIEFSSTGNDLSVNNPYRREEVLDPPLTEVGRLQAKALRPITKDLSLEMVVVSPLSRATQTALLAFPHLLSSAPGAPRRFRSSATKV